MKRITLLVLAMSLVLVACTSSDAATTTEPEPVEKVGTLTVVQDDALGVTIYVGGGIVVAVVTGEATTDVDRVTAETELDHGIKRLIDRENGAIVYRTCTGFSWMTCGADAIPLADLR